MARGRSGQSGAIHARGRRHIFPMLAVLASFAAAALGFLPVFAQEEGAVSGLTLTSDSPGTLAMSWDVPDQTPTDYRVNWGKSAEDFPSYAENDGNAYPTTNSHTVTGLDEGIEYKVRVRARYRGDELNEGQTQWSTPWSEAANITIASQAPEATPVPTPEPVDSAPAAPTGLTAAAAHDSVTITWTAPAGSTVTGYQILRRQTGVDEPGDFQVHVDDTGNTDTTYTDTDVEAEARYVYRVKARNGDLLSPRSSFANAELPASPDPDSTRDGAVDLGDITGLSSARFSRHTIKGGNDRVDYFKFSITEPKLVTLGLRQLDFDADLVLEDSEGTALGESRNDGAANEAKVATLLEGTYYIRVEAREKGVNQYVLRYGVGEPDPEKVDKARKSALKADPAVSLSMNTLTVEEEDSATYTVVLASQPTADVTVTVSAPSDSGISVDNATLTFTDTDWDVEQTVTVSAAADDNTVTDTAVISHAAASTDTDYNGITVENVTVTIHDSSFRIRIEDGDEALTVTEGDSAGAELCFRLSDVPTEDVTVTLAPDGDSELHIYPAEFTIAGSDEFCAVVTAGPDPDADNDEATVTLQAAGGGYDDTPAEESVVTVADLGSSPPRGVYVSVQDLAIQEGDNPTYVVALTSQPTGDVTIEIAAFNDRGSDGQNNVNTVPQSVQPSRDSRSVVFTTENWHVAQTVTVNSTEDPDADDHMATVFHTVSGADYGENGVTAQSIRVSVEDVAWVYYYLDSPLVVDEAIGTFTVTITSLFRSPFPPKRPHIFLFQSIDLFEGRAIPNPASSAQNCSEDGDFAERNTFHYFSPGDYHPISSDFADYRASVQYIVPICNDARTEPTEYFRLYLRDHPTLWKGVVNVPQFDGDNTYDWGIYNTIAIRDNDPPGVIVSQAELEVTEEDTVGATYTVQLATQPDSNVTIRVQGAEGTDLNVSPTEMTFPGGTFSVAKTVTVTARADADTVDDRVTLTHSASGSGYDRVPIDSVAVTVKENDKGVNLSPPVLEVEEGDVAGSTYTVWLNTRPSDAVTVDIAGHVGTDLTPDRTVLAFDRDNWDVPQTVTVTAAADDDFLNDSVTLTHTPSGGDHESLPASALPVIVRDQGGVIVKPTSLSVVEGDTEGGSYAVALRQEPSANVTITITKAGSSGVSVDETILIFTPQDWSQEQTVTVTAAADDDDDQGSANISHAASGGGYDGVPVDGVSVRTLEPDLFQIATTPQFLRILEGRSATYHLELTQEPVGNGTTTITVSSDDSARVTVSPTSLDFTRDNYNVPRAIMVTTTADADDDDNLVILTNTGSGGGYNGVTRDLRVTVLEEDDRGVTASETSRTVVEEGTSTYTLVLDSEPTDDVRVALSVSADSGFTVNDRYVTFTTGNWEEEQTITISGTADDDAYGESGTITHLPTGGGYEGAPADSVDVTVTDDDTPGITVEPTTLGVTEGNSNTYTVVLDTRPGEDVTVTITPTGDATVTADETELTFTPDTWDTEQTVRVSAAEDADADDETATLEHTVSGYGAVTSAEDVDVTVTDNEPAVVVTFGQAAYAADESDNSGTTNEEEHKAVIKVKLDRDPDRQVVVDLVVIEQGAEKDDDYTGIPPSVTFEDGETEVEFTFTAVDDTLDDDDESVKIAFDDLPARVNSGTPAETTISINDDDDPHVTVSFEESSYPVAESDDASTMDDEENKVEVKVTLSADPERTVVIPITPTDQGGASDLDYSGVPPNVTFDRGETEKTFTLTALHDTVDDDDESVLLTFGTLPTRVTEGVTPEATIAITDDDDPEVKVSFKQSSYPVAESDDASTMEDEENKVEVEVVLSADPERTVIIPITPTNQGGASNADYSVPASVTFNRGDTEKTFTFTALHDTVDDDGESVKLTFGVLPVRVTRADTNVETVVNIDDDDKPTSLIVNFEQSSYDVGEGSSVKVKLTLDDDPEMDVTIPITPTNQGGATNADYSGVEANVTFESGDTEKTFTVTAVDDTVDDDDESVKLTFGTLPSIVSAGTIDETVVNFSDDDVPAVTVRFEKSSDAVAESDDASTMGEKENEVTVKVILSADPERTVTIPIIWTNQGGASNSDYSGVENNVVFNDGETEKTFTFMATHDTVDDDGESVKLAFGDLPTRVSEGATTETTISINDDDDPEVRVRFELGSYPVAESDDGSTSGVMENEVEVKVVLDADPERTVIIPIDKTDQGGASDLDYSGVPPNVTFDKGETEKTFTFTALHDTVDDDDESVLLTFGDLPTRVSEGATTETIIRIDDDDDPEVRVRFESDSYTVVEGNSVEIKAILSADPERIARITIARRDQGETSGADYEVTPRVITFNPGETERIITFTAKSDTVDDDYDMVRLGFGTLPDRRVSRGDPRFAMVEIIDARLAPISLQENPCLADWPIDMAIHGSMLYVVHNVQFGTDMVRAYNLDTLEHQPDKDIPVENIATSGLWTDGDTMWVTKDPLTYSLDDSPPTKLFAYDLTAAPPVRDSSKDIPLADDNRNPQGVHAVDGILWVGDLGVEKIFAYDLATGARLAGRDIDVSSDARPLGDVSHIGIWTDGATMWTADPNVRQAVRVGRGE